MDAYHTGKQYQGTGKLQAKDKALVVNGRSNNNHSLLVGVKITLVFYQGASS